MRLRLPRLGCLSITALIVVAVIVTAVIMLRPVPLPSPEPLPAQEAQTDLMRLRPVASFAQIGDPQARSVALFEEAGRVIRHPRCMNCHPRTDSPTQTDAMRPHFPAVTRGPDGGGDPLLRCTTCHHAANFAPSGIPGNPDGKLAPLEQAWQDKSLGEICRQLLDPQRTHMSRTELLDHMAQDELVGWAWHPGGDRTPAPGTQAEFGALIAAWIATGARCPA